MGRGPERIEASIIEAFRKRPNGTYSTLELSEIAFGDGAPDKPKRVSLLRAARNAAKRLYDAKEANWQAQREERPQAEMIFFNAANLRSYAIGRLRTNFLNNHDSVENLEREIDGGGDRDTAEYLIAGGAWWAYSEQARLNMLGIKSGAEYDAMAKVLRHIAAQYGMSLSDVGLE